MRMSVRVVRVRMRMRIHLRIPLNLIHLRLRIRIQAVALPIALPVALPIPVNLHRRVRAQRRQQPRRMRGRDRHRQRRARGGRGRGSARRESVLDDPPRGRGGMRGGGLGERGAQGGLLRGLALAVGRRCRCCRRSGGGSRRGGRGGDRVGALDAAEGGVGYGRGGGCTGCSLTLLHLLLERPAALDALHLLAASITNRPRP
ncbi:hypothetical protein B0H19DRAFT_1152616 [Mycena capillaripes]|nr:hypothetical protein B0H19DRAFT_1152616 [Mycena capillaripes]